MVSMPSTGLLPFLHCINMEQIMKAEKKVSMPSTGLLPFLLNKFRTEAEARECVNALNGLTSISTVASRNP